MNIVQIDPPNWVCLSSVGSISIQNYGRIVGLIDYGRISMAIRTSVENLLIDRGDWESIGLRCFGVRCRVTVYFELIDLYEG